MTPLLLDNPENQLFSLELVTISTLTCTDKSMKDTSRGVPVFKTERL